MVNPGTGAERLIIVDPLVVISTSPYVATGGPTDHSHLLDFGDSPGGLGGSEQTSYGRMIRQRGTANIALLIRADNDYEPTLGTPIFLYDVSVDGQFTVFSGTIDNVDYSWYGRDGDRLAALSCVSFESAFDRIRLPARLWNAVSCGQIFRDILVYAGGWQGTTGQIDDGPDQDTWLVQDFPTIAEQFDKLALAAGFIWSVNVATLAITFAKPAISPSPWTLSDADCLWEQADYKSDLHDFRDKQIITGDFDAFGRSNEVFYGPLQRIYTLRNPVHDVTGASITQNTQNTATGTFSGQPAVGDQVTINYPQSGSSYNWAPSSPYQVNWYIVDPNNHRQVCTSAGTSGTTEPLWNDIGGHTTDSSVQWLDHGDIGFGPYQLAVYNFTDQIDNTAYGQVLIGGTTAQTCQNLVNAINADTASRGITYSMPTWENQLINADAPIGSTFVVRNKYTGQGAKTSLKRTGTAFNWSGPLTDGGITTFGTYVLNVGIATASSQDKSVSYTPGSAVIYLNGVFHTYENLALEYHRADGNAIAVENTALVAARAAIDHGTGKYQALTSDNSATPPQLLSEAQAALSAYEEIPSFFTFQTFRPGLDINQALTIEFRRPQGPNPQIGSPNGAYNFRRRIRINPSSPPSLLYLFDFTWQFSGTYPYLATIPNGGKIYNSHGFDIIFSYDANGQRLLDWEIQSYDPTTGALVFWIFFGAQLDRLFGTDVYMFYSNPDITSLQSSGPVWSSTPVAGSAGDSGNWSGVFHLAENGGPYKDSSTIARNSIAVSTIPPTRVPGLWGYAQSFTAADQQFIEFVNEISSGYEEAGCCFSMWLNTTSGGVGTIMGIVDNGLGSATGAQGYIDTTGHATAKDITHNAIATSVATINDGQWHYVIFQDDGFGFISVIVDNVAVSTTYLGTPVQSPGSQVLGALRGLLHYYDGIITEFHTFGIPHIAQWNLDEYNNQNPTTHAAWYTIQAEEPWGLAPWIIQEVEGEVIPCCTTLGGNRGMVRYTVHCVNISQIGSYLDFWKGLGGGGSAGGSIPTYSGGTAGTGGTAAGSAVQVEQSGAVIGIEPAINFIPGIGASFFLADDPSNQRVNITIGLSSSTGIIFGTWGDLPPTPTTGAGTTYFFTDSLYTCATYDGTGWTYFLDGKVAFLPQLYNWQGFQGLCVLDTTHGYSALSNFAGTTGVKYQYGNLLLLSGGEYLGVACFRVGMAPFYVSDNETCAMMITDGAILVKFSVASGLTNGSPTIKLAKYTGVGGGGMGTALSADAFQLMITPFLWFKIRGQIGGRIRFLMSSDGLHYYEMFNDLESNIFSGAPNTIGWGLLAQDGGPPQTFSDLVSWEGELGATQITVTTTTVAIGEGTPSREITITQLITTATSATFALDDDGVGGVFYPTSVSLAAGAPGQHVGFVYIAPIGTTDPVLITATASGSLSSFRKIELPIGVATQYAADAFAGSPGDLLDGHVPDIGSAWVEPYSSGVLDLTLDGAGGVYAVAGTATPTIRGSGIYNSMADPANLPFPSGTAVGDLVIVMAANTNNLFNPTGWTVNQNTGGSCSSIAGAVWSKVMTSPDISAGSVDIHPNGAHWGCYAIVTIIGGGSISIREAPIACHTPGSGSASLATSSGVQAGDLGLYFGSAWLDTTTVTIDTGSALQSTTTVIAGSLYGGLVSGSGVQTIGYTYTGSAGNGDVEIIVIVQGGVNPDAEYLIPTPAPQVFNDVAVTYTGIDTSTLLPSVLSFGANSASKEGYYMQVQAGGTEAGVWVAGSQSTFTAATGSTSGSMDLRIAIRTINSLQYVFFLIDGVMLTGAPWQDNSLGSGDAGLLPKIVASPASTDSVASDFKAENADWS